MAAYEKTTECRAEMLAQKNEQKRKHDAPNAAALQQVSFNARKHCGMHIT